MKVLVFLRNGFEELELVAPVDVLRRAGLAVTIASCEESLSVQGKNSMVLAADALLDDCRTHEYDCLLIPGGPGTAAMRRDERVIKAVQEAQDAGKWIAAICAAPLVLKDAGVIQSRPHTAHFSTADELPGMDSDSAVVIVGNLITSQGAGTALPFGLAIVSRLLGEDAAQQISKSICYPG